MPRLFLALLPFLALSGAAIRVQTPPAAPLRYHPQNALYPQQWNLTATHAEDAWQISRGAPITVAVLDTGYAALPELAGRVWNGYDFVSDPQKSGDGDGRDPDATDPGTTAYHASMVASLIAGAHVGRGVAGLNPRARILQVRVAEAAGLVRPEDLVDALRWSAGLSVPGTPPNPHPARVINLSLFADYIPLTVCDKRVQAALNEVAARGVVVVAGAGNDDADAAGYTPAGCRGVISVTATDGAGLRAHYANWGETVTLAAPGGTDPGSPVPASTPRGVQRRTGTSLAAPLVSGVVSLMLGVAPRLTPAQVAGLLRESATPFPAGSCDPQNTTKTCGAGLLDAGRALAATKKLAARSAGF